MAAEFAQPGRPWQMPMDAYRRGGEFVVNNVPAKIVADHGIECSVSLQIE